MRAPVVMIGYTRKETLKRSLLNLSRCYGLDGREIYLFLDAACKPEHEQSVAEMYACAAKVRNDVLPQLKIIKRERNYGVPGNLISAVTQILDEYGRIIFFEDDVLVSRTFLTFMDSALDFYESDKRIWCINGNSGPYVRIPKDYPYDVYLTPRNLPWGWATWKDRWHGVDFTLRDWPADVQNEDFVARVGITGSEMYNLFNCVYKGTVRTWDVQCTYFMIKHNMYAVEPRYRMTKNIGFATLGAVNCCGRNMTLERMKYYNFKPRLIEGLLESPDIIASIRYAWCNPSMASRIIRKAHRIIQWFGPHYNEPIDVM